MPNPINESSERVLRAAEEIRNVCRHQNAEDAPQSGVYNILFDKEKF